MATARRVSDVSPKRLAELHDGAETKTLTEGLAVNFAALMCAAFPKLAQAAKGLEAESKAGITRRMVLAAEIAQENGIHSADLATHSSDTVRGWACFLIARQDMTLADYLKALRPLADDDHFGVREWAWLALRPHIAADLSGAISELTPWTGSASANIRRFASEATRPRGVWCAHLKPLKENPELGLPILEPLRTDPEPYVQDSVANWLNDASKDQPDWVCAICDRWEQENPTPATQRITKRALRTVRKS